MKVEVAVELIKQRLIGGDSNSDTKHKFHDQVIKQYITLAMEQLSGQAQQGMVNYEDIGYMDCYIKPFEDVEIKQNVNRDEYYIDLPAKPAQLYKNAGIKIIQYMKSKEYQFRYMANNRANVYFNLPSFKISNEVRYYVENQKVFFSDHIMKNTTEKLLVKLITFENLEDEDEIPIFAGKELDFIDVIFQMLMGTQPKDDITDNQSLPKQQ